MVNHNIFPHIAGKWSEIGKAIPWPFSAATKIHWPDDSKQLKTWQESSLQIQLNGQVFVLKYMFLTIISIDLIQRLWDPHFRPNYQKKSMSNSVREVIIFL